MTDNILMIFIIIIIVLGMPWLFKLYMKYIDWVFRN